MSMALILIMMFSGALRAENSSIFAIFGWLLLATGPVFSALIFTGKALLRLFSSPFHLRKLIGLGFQIVLMAIYFFPVIVDNEELIGPVLAAGVAYSSVYTVTGLVMSAMALHNQPKTLTEE